MDCLLFCKLPFTWLDRYFSCEPDHLPRHIDWHPFFQDVHEVGLINPGKGEAGFHLYGNFCNRNPRLVISFLDCTITSLHRHYFSFLDTGNRSNEWVVLITEWKIIKKVKVSIKPQCLNLWMVTGLVAGNALNGGVEVTYSIIVLKTIHFTQTYFWDELRKIFHTFLWRQLNLYA